MCKKITTSQLSVSKLSIHWPETTITQTVTVDGKYPGAVAGRTWVRRTGGHVIITQGDEHAVSFDSLDEARAVLGALSRVLDWQDDQ